MSFWGVVIATWLAATVEWVEAFTIVLAVALSIGWRSALGAAAAALLLLTAMTAVTGGALHAGLELPWLQGVIGVFLLLFGIRWLGKAIARGAGLKALHDEDKAFAKAQTKLAEDSPRGAWLVAFKAVLLEGLEVWLIVVALGAPTHRTLLAAAAAVVALLGVALLGLFIHRPLRRVPENTMKFVVGGMITAFGSFWTLESLGYAWPLGDASLLLLVAFYLGGGWLLTRLLRRDPTAVGGAA
ncbi:hypothetical protein BJI67_01340 [Acidihalobacter aeolianus]|uniref:GDT1 family protein n=1 Tax=Acidihalobacter aeolianus TaxID=2792603 RepID=A0A1D8K4N3_9GAMM|nr:hypothetical protein [Acidihalobacter aeolianus]AOV15894.1 hypothetical protein BJI67_01340 [Acidihalobacter aeolianus]